MNLIAAWDFVLGVVSNDATDSVLVDTQMAVYTSLKLHKMSKHFGVIAVSNELRPESRSLSA